MSDEAKYILAAIIGVLASIFVNTCVYGDKEIPVEVRTDTVVVSEVRIDTVVIHDIVEKRRYITDTVYIQCEGRDSVPLAVVSKEYSDSLFRAVVSGIEPLSLDTMEVYPRTRYVYRDITKTEYVTDKMPLYAVASFNGISRHLYPSVGIYTIYDRKWLYGAEIGFYDDFKPYYSVKIGIKFK